MTNALPKAVKGRKASYSTAMGAAFLGDSRDLLKGLADESVNLIVTSPPFALNRKKDYGNVADKEYVEWFLPFGKEFFRVLKPDGSLVIDIGGTWNKGEPTRSLYHFDLLIALCRQCNFKLAQEFYWHNTAKLPSPAEWVNVRRLRVKDAVNPVWWLSKGAFPKANNRNILRPYSESMKDLIRNGYKAKLRPSGHDISGKFQKDNGGAIPPNLLEIPNTDSNGVYLRKCREAKIRVHSARFPEPLPEFFIKFLTVAGDLVVDPFAGSNVTGSVCERLGRRWLAFELEPEYVRGSKYRFESVHSAGQTA